MNSSFFFPFSLLLGASYSCSVVQHAQKYNINPVVHVDLLTSGSPVKPAKKVKPTEFRGSVLVLECNSAVCCDVAFMLYFYK